MKTNPKFRISALAALMLALSACALISPPPPSEHLHLERVSFSALPGWHDDRGFAAALAAFRRSCVKAVPDFGDAAAWRRACDAAQKTRETNYSARAYFKRWFMPYAASGNDGAEGLFTGYYVPELRGSPRRGGVYQTPLYAPPLDMIAVDLGAFKKDLKGQHIVGKLAGRELVPYDARAKIAEGSLKKRARPLVWVSSPIDAFFLEVQGSGRIRLPDGSIMPLGYDTSNGRAYVSIGHLMLENGDLQRPVTMGSIRVWLAAHPHEAQQVMDANPSYVFFRRLPNADIIGAQGVALTPGHSLAVDPSFVPLGAPLWLDTTDASGRPLRRLMVAQDTGGAIKGPVRGDVFWGAGRAAAREAGAMQNSGRYYLLLPKGVTPP
ncbi:MAG: murein transglycosylase A [Alphaproteobacteria bacterium]|nr:murein transglycosylase A [Alphaproteobacteria bacterium]